MSEVWSDDWQARLTEAVREKGHTLLLDLLKSRPGLTYSRMCEDLGGFAPIQLIRRFYAEARNSNRVCEALADALYRCVLEAFPAGWNNGPEALSKRLLTLTGWQSEAESTGGLSHLSQRLAAVVQYLFRISPPPDGWQPAGSDDPLLAESLLVWLG